MGIALYAARAEDARVIAGMSRDLIEAGLGWSWRSPHVRRAVARGDHLVVVARDDLSHKVVGFGIMQLSIHQANLSLLAICPEYQRKGVGQQIVRWLEECAQVAGISTVTLQVRANNLSAQRFYRSLGYLVERRLSGYYRGRESALRMRHRIGYADRVDNSEWAVRQLSQIATDVET